MVMFVVFVAVCCDMFVGELHLGYMFDMLVVSCIIAFSISFALCLLRMELKCDQSTQTTLAVMYEDEVHDMSVQTTQTGSFSALMEVPDVQELAMVAFGKTVPWAPPARLQLPSKHVIGITCWDSDSEAFSVAWSCWLELKPLHPYQALAVLASASRLLGAISVLRRKYEPRVLHIVAILLSTAWELDCECVSSFERNSYLGKMNLHGQGALVKEATLSCIVELGNSIHEIC